MPRSSSASPVSAARHVSLVALPDAGMATLAGIYDVMNAPALMGLPNATHRSPFQVEIVGEVDGPMPLASGVALPVQRRIDELEATDIVIVPSLLVRSAGWQVGRYPRLVAAHSRRPAPAHRRRDAPQSDREPAGFLIRSSGER